MISDPESGMVDLMLDFLNVGETAGKGFDAWLADARHYGAKALPKMLVNPGAGAAGITGEARAFFEHLIGHEAGPDMEGWQQFVVHARDERGDGVADYMIEVLIKKGETWTPFNDMYTDVHAYGPDSSYRCFHVRLPKGIASGQFQLMIRIHASTGTELMAYQGYGDTHVQLTATSEPVELDISAVNKPGATLFHPFTTTLIEIILNREPLPFNGMSRLFQIS